MFFPAAFKFALFWAMVVLAAPHDAGLPSDGGSVKAEVIGRTQGKGSNFVAPFTPAYSSESLFGADNAGLDTRGMGINCKGSILCGGFCPPIIDDIRDLVKKIDDNKEWSNGQGVVCKYCNRCAPNAPNCPPGTYANAICAFTQKMKDGDRVSGLKIKELVDRLMHNGCKRCGSAPIHDGNNVDDGELTINYVLTGCGDRDEICPDPDEQRQTQTENPWVPIT